MKFLAFVVATLAFLGTARISGFEDIPPGLSNWERTDGYPAIAVAAT